MLQYILSFWMSIALCLLCSAQDFYDLHQVREIRIQFEEEQWAQILDSLKQQGEGRLSARVSIDGIALDGIGVRFKGNSSYYNVRKDQHSKLPFNLKANFRKKDQRFPGGYHTLKLSNVFRDPSFVREVLSYEIAREYMAAPQANFARVYVNDEYLGIYNNAESVDEDFLQRHFGSHKGAFFKCDPQWTIDLPPGCTAGDKSALLDQGPDLICYQQNYEMKSDTGWASLHQLIKRLNSAPDQLESILNLDEVLWMLAFDNVLVNLDSYIGRLSHNYYLYRDTFGIFHPVVWDMNLSFGAFRFPNEGRAYTNQALQTLSPLSHYQNPKRPLISQVLKNDLNRKIYIAHIKTILNSHIWNQSYLQRTGEIQGIIGDFVRADSNKLYSYDDFVNNAVQSTTINQTPIIGIEELMRVRGQYLKKHPLIAEKHPTIHSFTSQKNGTQQEITAVVQGADRVLLAYRYKEFAPFKRVAMNRGEEIVPGHRKYAYIFDGSEFVPLHYYFIAESAKSVALSPERAAYQYHEMK